MIVTINIPSCTGCCDGGVVCADKYGTDIHATFTGVLSCDGCYTVGEPGSRKDYKISFTGLSGTSTLTWNGTTAWEGVVGTGTLVKYDTDDRTCGGDPVDTETSDILLSVTCDTTTGEIAGIAAQAGYPVIGFALINFYLYSSVDPFELVRDNEIVECIPEGTFGIVGAFDGTLELSEI